MEKEKKFLRAYKDEKNNNNIDDESSDVNRKMIIKIHYKNGDTYEGQINAQNEKDGKGTFICADRKRINGYEYQGMWKDNMRDGKKARCYYYNDEFYIGDFSQDQRHG